MIFGLFGGEKKRNQELRDAASEGRTDQVSKLLAKGANVHEPDPSSGETALNLAVNGMHLDTARALLSGGANVNLQSSAGYSPLFIAASKGDDALAMVDALLGAGASVDIGPKAGESAGATPLYVAAARGASKLFQRLISAGASPVIRLKDQSTLMHAAALGGSTEIVRIAHGLGAPVEAPREDGMTPLIVAAVSGHVDAAVFLLELGADLELRDAEGRTPLMAATFNNHTKVVKALLQRGAQPDAVGKTGTTEMNALCSAAMRGANEMVQALIDAGASVDAKLRGQPAIIDLAKAAGHESTVQVLMAGRKRQRAEGKKAQGAQREIESLWQDIILSIIQQDKGSLRELSEAKQFGALASDGQLLVACVLGDSKHAQSLLAAGANPSKQFPEVLDGMTPLYAAVGSARSLEITRLLLAHGADANQTWSQGSTPIFETVSEEHLDLAKLLLSKGANVNARLDNGTTPLLQSVRNGSTRTVVDVLLDAGADINAVAGKDGLGAFGWALNRLDLKLAEHLFERGAEPNFGSIETLSLAIAEHGSLAFIRALEERGCKLIRDDQRGRMAFVSARNPDPEVFDYFLNHGADPGEGNDYGYTPLILAALNNRPTLVRRYLERGDDAAVRDVDGETALSLALEKRHDEAIEVLREFHAEEMGDSTLDPAAAMLKAAGDGALGTILNLRDAGISINSEDDEGNSPLMLAVTAGHLGVVRSLYHLGADINHRNHAGETALGIAKASDSTDMVNSLQEFGALDAMTGELRTLSSMFGGIPIFNAGDTMFGRMSRPYKEKPPYDNSESDSEAESEKDASDELSDDGDDELPQESGANASVEAKLKLLGQVLDSDQIKEQVQEAVLEQLTQKLDNWRVSHETSGLADDELAELNRILGLFGLGGDEAEESTRTPLFEAVQAQDLGAVKKLIKGGVDINEADADGNTPLLMAILTGEDKFIEGLLKLGADPNKSRPDGKGPLFGCVRTRKDKVTQLLLKAGIAVDAPFSVEHNGTAVEGCTALYAAAFLGQVSACKILLGGGAQIDAANDVGYSPLMAAVEGGHDDVIDFLLKSGANADPEVVACVHVEGLGGSSPLITATRKENLPVIKKLLKRGVDVNRPAPNGWTPLKSAAHQGNLEIVKALLDAGADPNIADDTNYTPLMNAVSGEHEDIVKLLLKFHADPNIQGGENPADDDWEPGRTALMDAAFSGNLSIARELLKQGANPNLLNSAGRTALHSAVISANTDMVSLLLKSGADPDVYGNDDGRLSALDMALRRWASEGEDDREGVVSDVLELLLKKGMPSDHGSLSETALELVAEGYLEVIDLLLKHDIAVDPDFSTNGASQLFMTAAIGDERIEAAEWLLQIGADANFKIPTGLSVLSLAVRNGAVRLAETLLAAGADVMGRNGAGVLAYDLAVLYDHHELAGLLIAQMNRVVPEVDEQDSGGDTALMRAVKSADTKAIAESLATGADPSRRDLRGDSPLSYAVTHDLDEAVQLLRTAGAERLAGNDGSASIVTAGSQGALGTIFDLLDAGVAIDATDAMGDTALTAAEAHLGVVRALAKMGADLAHRNQAGVTAYMIAAASNRALMMQALEELGSPLDEPAELDGIAQVQAALKSLHSDESADDSDESDAGSEGYSDSDELVMASLMGDAIAVSRRLASGADVNQENDEGLTPLAAALAGLMGDDLNRRRERDFLQLIDSLIAAGADPNAHTASLLVLGVMTGRVHIVNALIRAGVEIDTLEELPIDDVGGTMRANALFVALAPNEDDALTDERVSLALVRAGIDLSFTNDDGALVVHYAATAGMTKTLGEILDRTPGAIDAQDNDGSTPLMLAAERNRLEAIRVLLERGADRNIRDAEGRTAAEVAVTKGHQLAADLASA